MDFISNAISQDSRREYNICGKIAKVSLTRLEDILQLNQERECQKIKIEKREEMFEIEFNIKAQSGAMSQNTRRDFSTSGELAVFFLNRQEDPLLLNQETKYQIKIEKREEDFDESPYGIENEENISDNVGSISQQVIKKEKMFNETEFRAINDSNYHQLMRMKSALVKLTAIKQENDSEERPQSSSIDVAKQDSDLGLKETSVKEEQNDSHESEGRPEKQEQTFESSSQASTSASGPEGRGRRRIIKPVAAEDAAKVKIYSCAHCDHKTSIFGALKAHIRTHSGRKSFSCELCNYRSYHPTSLKRHLRTHSDRKSFSCELCNYRSYHSSDLKRHILRMHSQERQRPFSCEFCDYRSYEKATLKVHTRTHLGEKPYSCDFCDYKSNYKHHLKIHLYSHTGKKPFICEFCNYKCFLASVFETHQRLHTGEKPFSCEFCDYKSNYKQCLKIHLNSHSSLFQEKSTSKSSKVRPREKRFSCDNCDFKSVYSSHLKRHMMIHSGEKPFGCDLCEYKTCNSNHLKRHLSRHSREKRFSCKFCDYKSYQSSNLKAHLRTHKKKS